MIGRILLKASSLIMIIGGALAIPAGISALLGVFTLASALHLGNSSYLLIAVSAVCIASGAVHLIAGIIGIQRFQSEKTFKKCILWGALSAALVILTNIISTAAGNDFDLGSLFIGLALPAVYIVSAYLNHRETL